MRARRRNAGREREIFAPKHNADQMSQVGASRSSIDARFVANGCADARRRGESAIASTGVERDRPRFSYAATASGEGSRFSMSMTPMRRPSMAMTPRRNSLAVSAATSGVGWICSSPAVKMSETPSTSRPAT